MILFLVVCFVFPRAAYGFRLAVIELRYGAIILLLLIALLWILLKLGPKDRP